VKRLFTGARSRLLTVIAFGILAAGLFVWMFTGTGNYIPFVQPRQWQAVVYLDDADNAVQADRVQIAGVQVGKIVSATREGEQAKVVFDVDESAAPLHQGLRVRLGSRSLVEESYLDITDGQGAPLADGTVIPPSQVVPSVQVHDVLASLDDKTRADAGSLLRSMGPATAGTGPDTARIMNGLGDLGRQGNTALDAIAAQSSDLRTLSQQLPVVLNSLNTSQGQIAGLVTDAQQLTHAVAGRQDQVQAVVNKLPGVLDSAKDASGGLDDISGSLAPVASNLRTASPYLSQALKQLPDTTKDLHGLLPHLDQVLDKAPTTLDKIPDFDDNVQDVIPPTRALLQDLNPALNYLAPYGDEVGQFLSNFNSVLQYTDEKGAHYIRLQPVINFPNSIQSPVKLPQVTTYTNPFPPDGKAGNPGPFGNTPYPRVEREGQ
jgi:phospholipid/cholesterol/gamma-HCH transport system substrate-binding protein